MLVVRLTFAALLLNSLCWSAAQSAERATRAHKLIQTPRVLVIAHRGDSRACPENTLPAFESAVAVGSDLVELDYVHSADGVPVVLHDDTLDRTTNACDVFSGMKISAKSKTLEELLRLDAGTWFGANFAGTKLPTLEQALETIQRGSVTLIERKQGDAATCVELLKRKGLLEEVVVQAFDWTFLEDCHKLAPELAIGALGFKDFRSDALPKIEKTGAVAIGWEAKSLTPEAIGQMKDAGYKVWAWTVDDPAHAQRLIEAGADGIITNVPGKIRTLVDAPQRATAGAQ
jgi:glycerophosphoryl diester phosphodiesterase